MQEIIEVTLAASDEYLRETGMVFAPVVHMFCEESPPDLHVGMVTCRRFRRGEDAAAAIEELGVLPSVVGATRLLVIWESQDLSTALQLPGGPFPSSVTVLHVAGGHMLYGFPFAAEIDEGGTAGRPPVKVAWAERTYWPDAPLPSPVERLLAVWRTRPGGRDVDSTVADLERRGYTVTRLGGVLTGG